MKKPLLLLLFFYLSQISYSQLDTLYLKNNEKIPCVIGRVGDNLIRYFIAGSTQYVKIDYSEVSDYLIVDDFFKMDENKDFSSEKVLEFPGFSQKEIYDALLDWIMCNQKFVLSNGLNYTNEDFYIIVGTMFTQEFSNLDLLTMMTILNTMSNNEPAEGINSYYVKYEVVLRVKNEKAKIYIKNLSIESTYDKLYSRPFADLYTRRVNNNGTETNNLKAIREVKRIIQEQLQSIEDHVYNVRANDTYENNLIKNLLLDNNW